MSLCSEYLLVRGVLPETALQYGLEFDERPTRERIIERLGFDKLYNGVPLSAAASEILWAPVDAADGTRALWCARVFLQSKFGNPQPKTLVTAKRRPAPFIWPPTLKQARHANVPILITEGVPKGLLSLQAGAYPIALHGVWMGAQRNGDEKYALISEVAGFDLIGRLVYLAFDSDQSANNQVLQAVLRQAMLLFIHGADVRQLTTWDPARGKGIDDYIASAAGTNLEHQREVLAELAANAPPLFDGVRPHHLPLVTAELRNIALTPAQRSQLSKLLAKRLGVRVGALDVSQKEEGVDGLLKTAPRLLEKIEPWPEPVDAAVLFTEIHGVIAKHVCLEPHRAEVATLWAVFTYVYDLFTVVPILRIYSSDKLCGKSTLLDVLEQLVIRPVVVSDPTNAAMFRSTPKYHPSWLLDEGQHYVMPGSEMSHFLDSCYQKGRFAMRVNPNTMEVELFDVFGPVALASIKLLTDTVESRGIHIRMERKRGSVEVPQLRDTIDQNPEYFPTIRRKLARLRLDREEEIKTARPTRPPFLWNREWDKWRPLYILAHVVGGDWPKRVEACAKVIVGTEDVSVKSIGIEVLTRLRPYFRSKGPTLPEDFKLLPTEDILTYLNGDDEAPWADYKTKSGKIGLTAEKLRSHLRAYRIKSLQKKRGGARVRGYWLPDFEVAFESYLPAEDPPAEGKGPDDDDDGGGNGGGIGGGVDGRVGGPPAPTPTSNGAENQAEAPQNTEKQAEKHITPPTPPFQGLQPGSVVVSPSGSTIQGTQVDVFNSSPDPLCTQVENINLGTLDGSAATTYESVLGLKGLEGGLAGYIIFSDATALTEFTQALPSDLSQIGLDIETFVPGKEARAGGPKKSESRLGTSLDWQVARIRLLSLSIPNRTPVVIDLRADPDPSTPIRIAVGVLLERLRSAELVGHNLRFDLCFLEHEFGWRAGRVWDTWVAAELLLNDDRELASKELLPRMAKPGPTALVSILRADLGVDLDKTLGGGAESDFGLPVLSQAQYAYSAGDVAHLFAEAAFQRSKLEQAGMTEISQIEMELVPTMAHMEIIGVPLMTNILEEALAGFAAERVGIEEKILPAMRAVGFDPHLDYSPISKFYLKAPSPKKKPKPVNINGSNLKQHYFHAMEKRLNIQLPRTDKGKQRQWLADDTGPECPLSITEDFISLKRETLRPIDDPVARLYAEWLALSTIITGIEQRRKHIGLDGRVHPIHDQMSANTGRISTSEPAMSNLPRSTRVNPLRRAVQAPPGCVLVQADLGQIELRAQAHYTGEPTMIKLFNLPEGDPRGDIYRLFASWEATRLTGREVRVEDIPAKGEQRNQTKPTVLGKAYLMGEARFIQYAHDSYGVDFTPEQARAASELYFEKFPGIKAWHDRAWQKANANLVTEGRTHLGRRRLVLAIPGDRSHGYRQAQAQINYVIQATCADGLKLAIILIVKALPPGAELILTIHDELLVLCRAGQAEEVMRTLEESVITAYKRALGEPLKVPIIIKPVTIQNWSEK
jgi:putative DNA primase/helicase